MRAREVKRILRQHEIFYNDVARAARVSYSMVRQWASRRRVSSRLDRIVDQLLIKRGGQPVFHRDEAA